MRPFVVRAGVSATMLLLCGCIGFPSEFPDSIESPPSLEPLRSPVKKAEDTPGKQVVMHIQCELATMTAKYRVQLEQYRYVAAATLQMDVFNTEGLNASLSFINPVAPVYPNDPKSRSWGINGQLTGSQHRQFTITFPIYFPGIYASYADKQDCDSASGIKGTLGLGEIVSDGFDAVAVAKKGLKADGDIQFPTGYATPSTSAGSAPFGSQIDFSIVEGVGGGPSLSATHFKYGPGSSGGGGGAGGSGGSGAGGNGSGAASAAGGGGGPLNLTRNTKDTLTIAFVPTCRPPKSFYSLDPVGGLYRKDVNGKYVEAFAPAAGGGYKPAHGGSYFKWPGHEPKYVQAPLGFVFEQGSFVEQDKADATGIHWYAQEPNLGVGTDDDDTVWLTLPECSEDESVQGLHIASGINAAVNAVTTMFLRNGILP